MHICEINASINMDEKMPKISEIIIYTDLSSSNIAYALITENIIDNIIKKVILKIPYKTSFLQNLADNRFLFPSEFVSSAFSILSCNISIRSELTPTPPVPSAIWFKNSSSASPNPTVLTVICDFLYFFRILPNPHDHDCPSVNKRTFVLFPHIS